MKRATLALCALVAGLLVLEGAIRLYSAVWFPRMMQLDDELGWKHTPNASRVFVNELGEAAEVRQNAYGHRGRAFPLAKSPGKFRILVLGDSFTEGVQVGEDDLFTARLERRNPQLEVLNAGVAGYGTVQEYLYLAHAGLQHNPDLVLVMVFENDLTDNCLSVYPGFGTRPYAGRTDGSLRIVSEPDPAGFAKYALPVPFASTLNRHSLFFYFVNGQYQKLRATHMRGLQGADRKRANQCGPYDVMFGVLDEMARLLSARGIRLALVFVPSREQAQQGSAAVLQPVIDYCARNGIAHLSLLPRFSRELSTTQPYLPTDMHWSRSGHRLAADELSRFLGSLVRDSVAERQ
jgi:lysophospholipase L1-like esterase